MIRSAARTLAFAAVLGTLAPAAMAQQLTPESVTPIIIEAFARNGCSFPLATAQTDLTEGIAALSGMAPDELRNPASAAYRAVDGAIGALMDAGRITVDPAAARIAMSDCGG